MRDFTQDGFPCLDTRPRAQPTAAASTGALAGFLATESRDMLRIYPITLHAWRMACWHRPEKRRPVLPCTQ